MAKTMTHARLLSRVRRELKRDGLSVRIRLVPSPEYPTTMPRTMLEVRTLDAAGVGRLMHHAAGDDPNDVMLGHMLSAQRAHRGIEDDVLAALLDRRRACLAVDDRNPVIMTDWMGKAVLHLPVTLLDLTGRHHHATHRMVRGEDGDWHHGDTREQVEIEMDGWRRGRRGAPRPICMTQTMATMLGARTDRTALLDAMLSTLRAVVDRTLETRRDFSAPTVSRASAMIEGMPVRLDRKGLAFDGLPIGGGATLRGDTVTMPTALPATVVTALPGRRLGDVVNGVGALADMIVARATTGGARLTLHLRAKRVDARAWALQDGDPETP